MKRIKLIPLAVTMLLAAPAFLTSCQEDAPEINYTMSVSVTNDFTKVVEAIDRGSLKNEEAIAKLAAAIDRMNSDQQAKLRPLLAAEAEAMQTLDATALTRAQRREQMRELRQANRAKIAAILTPEQREKLAQARHKGGHRHHGR